MKTLVVNRSDRKIELAYVSITICHWWC